MERLEKQIEFLTETDKEKEVFRQTFLCSGNRRENDAEHAWHMALMAVILSEYANEDVDVLKTVTMLLIHDIVEIDAGDTYAYDEEAIKTQAGREIKAADRIFGILPDDQAEKMKKLFFEFEEGESPEARFAKALDNIQPTILNDASCGKDWKEKGIRISQTIKRQQATPKGSEILWEKVQRPLLQKNIDNGNIIGDASLDEVEKRLE